MKASLLQNRRDVQEAVQKYGHLVKEKGFVNSLRHIVNVLIQSLPGVDVWDIQNMVEMELTRAFASRQAPVLGASTQAKFTTDYNSMKAASSGSNWYVLTWASHGQRWMNASKTYRSHRAALNVADRLRRDGAHVDIKEAATEEEAEAAANAGGPPRKVIEAGEAARRAMEMELTRAFASRQAPVLGASTQAKFTTDYNKGWTCEGCGTEGRHPFSDAEFDWSVQAMDRCDCGDLMCEQCRDECMANDHWGK